MSRFYAKYGLVLLLVIAVTSFSIVLPHSFFSAFTFRTIVYSIEILIILALAETVVLACGEYDFSITFTFGLLTVLIPGFMSNQGLPWYLACPIVIVIGVLIGAFSGFLIHFMKASSFVVTLAIGGIVTGLGGYYSQLFPRPMNHGAPLPRYFADLSNSTPFGIPSPVFVIVGVVIVLVVLMELTPAGRYIYALGTSRNHAILAGVRPGRYLVFVFALAGGVVGVAATVSSSLQLAGLNDPGTGSVSVALVFIGSMLGAAVITPGRPNALGTLIAVVFLGVMVGGLEQLGLSGYYQDVFYGLAFIVGIGLAGASTRWVAASRVRIRAAELRRLREARSDLVA